MNDVLNQHDNVVALPWRRLQEQQDHPPGQWSVGLITKYMIGNPG